MLKNSFLIVGLGNPGEEYRQSRHNVGFWTLERWLEKKKEEELEKYQVFKEIKKVNGEVARLKTSQWEIFLLKPQTFMNHSGKAVKKTLDFFQINPKNILVVHDELDLEIGKIRFSFNAGPAGHNGVLSVINWLKTKEFTRLRIGIHSTKRKKSKERDFVLSRFEKEEELEIKKAIEKSAKAIDVFLEEGFEKAAALFN